MRVQYPLRRIRKRDGYPSAIYDLPNFGPNGDLTGMRLYFGWENAMPVRLGAYIYDCRSRPDIYEAAHP